MGDKYVARVYDSSSAEGWKSAIAEAARAAGLTKFEGAVSLELRFNFKRPKSHFTKGGLVKHTAPAHHTQRSDLDNLEKAVEDALTRLGAWQDDSFVVRKFSSKDWAIGNSAGGCHITISEL
jgi:Holliday junction resolvase